MLCFDSCFPKLEVCLLTLPRFKVNIKVDAPIVSIPSVSEKEEIANTNLVLDFGQLWIKTIIVMIACKEV